MYKFNHFIAESFTVRNIPADVVRALTTHYAAGLLHDIKPIVAEKVFARKDWMKLPQDDFDNMPLAYAIAIRDHDVWWFGVIDQLDVEAFGIGQASISLETNHPDYHYRDFKLDDLFGKEVYMFPSDSQRKYAKLKQRKINKWYKQDAEAVNRYYQFKNFALKVEDLINEINDISFKKLGERYLVWYDFTRDDTINFEIQYSFRRHLLTTKLSAHDDRLLKDIGKTLSYINREHTGLANNRQDGKVVKEHADEVIKALILIRDKFKQMKNIPS